MQKSTSTKAIQQCGSCTSPQSTSPMDRESGLCQEPLPPPSYVGVGCGWKLSGTGFALARLRSGQGLPPPKSVAEEVTGWSWECLKSQHLDTAAGLLLHDLRGDNQAEERGTGSSIKKSEFQVNSKHFLISSSPTSDCVSVPGVCQKILCLGCSVSHP